MSPQTRVSNSMYCFLPTEVEGFGPLAELALDMRWSRDHYADKLWQQFDPALWELTQNPWVVLPTVSRDKRQHKSAAPEFHKKVDALVQNCLRSRPLSLVLIMARL
jgi:glycogen phosphorylase